MFRKDLQKDLAHFTSLVLSVTSSDTSLRKFIQAYGDFYFRFALDGHEDDPEGLEMLSEQQEAIEFHRRIQLEILHPVYLGGDLDQISLEATGRIDEEEARRRLVELCTEHDAEAILRKLAD